MSGERGRASDGRNGSRLLRTLGIGAAGVAAAAVIGFVAVRYASNEAPAALVDDYCVECHNGEVFAGSLRLDNRDPAQAAADAEVWERVIRKLKTGMMPPAGEPRPARAELDAFAAALERDIDSGSGARNPGHSALHRLNRTEYGNAVRDLLDLDIDPAALLPLDDSSEGFDNIATSLGVSPSLVQAYVSAAMKISRQALGDPTTPRTQASYQAPPDLAQDTHLEGLPLGTRGGIVIEHAFPLDATYELRVRRGFRSPPSARIDVTLDGVPVPIDDPRSIRLPVTAGPHRLALAVVDAHRPAGVDDVYGEYATNGSIQSVEIDGPFEPTGVGDTPSRRRVLICEPQTAAEEAPCAEQILATLATRAFRRPIGRETLAPLLAAFETGRAEGGFEVGIQHAVARVLVDPRFLYRFEQEPATAAAGTVYPLGDYDLASRLSFFLWSSIPDDALLEAAGSGRLSDPTALEAEVMRMLADPKAAALVDNFASQWLFLRELESITPDADDFDENLRRAMLEETQRLVGTVIRNDLGIVTLLDADFTFVDERLARHYGIEGVHGSHFRRIARNEDDPRRGLLGHGSILTLTSVTSRTSPVIRGSWVLENLLGSPPPVPPPNVETTLEGDDGGAVATTVRQRLEAHRANPVCASCHAIMDPIGLALENFDLIGAWRETDNGRPIDAHVTLADGTPLDGPAALRAALLGRQDAFVETATEKLLTYALGRGLEYYDRPAIRAIVAAAREDDYRFSALVLGVVRSDPFRLRIKGGGE